MGSGVGGAVDAGGKDGVGAGSLREKVGGGVGFGAGLGVGLGAELESCANSSLNIETLLIVPDPLHVDAQSVPTPICVKLLLRMLAR